MPSYNSITLIGHAGGDAELRFTPSGKALATFSLATNEYGGKDAAGQTTYDTQWFKIVVWGEKQATYAAEHICKGGLVLVTGPVRSRSWEGTDGRERFNVEVTSRELRVLGKTNPVSHDEGEGEALVPSESQEDLPF